MQKQTPHILVETMAEAVEMDAQGVVVALTAVVVAAVDPLDPVAPVALTVAVAVHN